MIGIASLRESFCVRNCAFGSVCFCAIKQDGNNSCSQLPHDTIFDRATQAAAVCVHWASRPFMWCEIAIVCTKLQWILWIACDTNQEFLSFLNVFRYPAERYSVPANAKRYFSQNSVIFFQKENRHKKLNTLWHYVYKYSPLLLWVQLQCLVNTWTVRKVPQCYVNRISFSL